MSSAARPRIAKAASPRRASAVPIALDHKAQEAVIRRASEVIADRDNALRWLGVPVPALNYATPISLLNSAKGREEVLVVPGQIEHGVL